MFEIDFEPEASLDFHTLGVLSKAEIDFYLNNFLEECRFQGNKNLIIIVGKGQVVNKEVLRLLNKFKFVKKFRYASFRRGEKGAIEIELF